MEIILGIAVIAIVAYVLTRKKDVAEANDSASYKVETPVPAGDIAPQPEPATTPIPLVVEGVGAVEVPAEAPVAVEAPAKKPRARKPTAPKAPAKPRAKKAKAE
jgi:hypothetical protein